MEIKFVFDMHLNSNKLDNACIKSDCTGNDNKLTGNTVMCMIFSRFSFFLFFFRDVHVIDIPTSASDGSVSDVFVHLTAQIGPSLNESRDLALVLHSARPVRWILSSSAQLVGSLVVLVRTKM